MFAHRTFNLSVHTKCHQQYMPRQNEHNDCKTENVISWIIYLNYLFGNVSEEPSEKILNFLNILGILWSKPSSVSAQTRW